MLKRFALGLALSLLAGAAFAANSTLSGLSSGVAVSNTDLFYDVQTVGSGGVKVTGTQLATFIFGKASGDCTATSGGVLTCTKTNGTAFGGLATVANGSSTGSVIYWGGSSWLTLAGNSSGTQCLQETAAGSPSWGACGSGGNPGGSNTQLQYNNSSAFGGISGATTNGTAVTFGSSDLILAGSSSGTTTLNAASAAGTTTATLPNNTGTIAELNMGQTWTAAQTFNSGDFVLNGSGSGSTTVNAAATASGTLTLPAATDTVVARATTDTLTNKTITSSTNSLGGVTAAFGSDAKGDIYTNSGASNVIERLAIGTTGQCLVVASGLPSWSTCSATATKGGPLLPSSVYFGAASGNAYPAFYTPATNTNTAGYLEGQGVVASLGADAPVTLQFNMPETIPGGTLKLRVLAMANATSGVAKVTVSDGATSAGSNIGATTLTSETQLSQTWSSADVLVENKITLTTAPTANQILTVLVTYNHTSWTLAAASVWQYSIVWE